MSDTRRALNAARRAVREADALAVTARGNLAAAERAALADLALSLGVAPDTLALDATWGCPTSAIGACVYNVAEDYGKDECLYCGQPLERK